MNWQEYGGKFVSPKLNNGDFDYWIVLDVTNMFDACGSDATYQYNVTIGVVSIQEAGQRNLEHAAESCGMSVDNLETDLAKVECLHSYGTYAPVRQFNGDNIRKLMREAKRFVDGDMAVLFGFVMDRPINRIGSTGWEFLKGDLDSALNRTIDSGSIEGQILGKMYARS